MKIGVLLESFKLPFAESVRTAARLRLDGVQIFAKGGVVFDGMKGRQISEVKRIIAGEGLEISALCADFGCRMFYYPDEMRPEIERSKRILALAKELGADVATTHIGVVPEDFESKEFDSMRAVCAELAAFANSTDGFFAVETGPEPAERLRRFLDTLGSRGVGVNLDPGNFVMVTGENPAEAVRVLSGYIVHTHAKDGRMLKKTDPRRIYTPGLSHLDPAQFGDYFEELPLGNGGVPWREYLSALREIGYTGYLTIEREVGEDPAADIAAAAEFLRNSIQTIF